MLLHSSFVQLKWEISGFTQLGFNYCHFLQQYQFAQCLSSSYVFLQRAGLVGVAGQYAARNVVVESRCAAEAASPRTVCAREQLKKGVPATHSPALVSPPVI